MNNSDLPESRSIEHDLMSRLDNDAETTRQKRKYNTGIAVGIGVIFLSAAAFTYLMIAMPPNLSVMYLAGCAASILLMLASIIVVSVRVRRLHANYFAQAGSTAGEYAEEIIRKMKSR